MLDDELMQMAAVENDMEKRKATNAELPMLRLCCANGPSLCQSSSAALLPCILIRLAIPPIGI